MATSAERSIRAEFSLEQASPAPTPRFLCGCRDCAFRLEEARLAFRSEECKETPGPPSRVYLCTKA